MSVKVFNPSPSGGTSFIVDTEANILGSTPDGSTVGITTDLTIPKIYWYNGSSWLEQSIGLSSVNANPDAGAFRDSDKRGYSENFIVNKMLVDTILGGNSLDIKGAIRLDNSQDPPVLQVYFNNQWNDYFVFDISSGVLRHNYLFATYDAYSGNSQRIGANGRPITQQYITTAGANGSVIVVNGGGE